MHTPLGAILVVLATASVVAGCRTSLSGGRAASGTVPALDVDSASAAGLSMRQVHDATALYLAKCARCHKFYDPSLYSADEWHSWMRKMSTKARLSPDQEELLSRYLDTVGAHNVAGTKGSGIQAR